MDESTNDVPRGLRFGGRRSSDPDRMHVLWFVAVILVAGCALVWPIYSAVPPIRPYIIGLPFSFAWVVGWLLVVFGALVVLYRVDEHGSAPNDVQHS